MKVNLQGRDIEILKFVYAFRVATFSQIHRRFFENVFRTAAPRRLRHLAKAEYLSMFINGTPEETHRYVALQEKAWAAIREQWPFEVDNPLFSSKSPRHDLRLAELFFSFEKLSTFDQFWSENLLQSSPALAEDPKISALAKLYADAALVLRPPDSEAYVYGVELEISKKSPERYRKKLMDYYLAKAIDGVLYISDSQAILDAVARVDSEIRGEAPSILHFALEKNVLASNGKIQFQNAKEGLIELF